MGSTWARFRVGFSSRVDLEILWETEFDRFVADDTVTLYISYGLQKDVGSEDLT